MEEEDEDEIQKQRNRKRKGSVKDRLDWSDKVVKVDRVIQDRIDWSDKVVVVEEEHEAETFIENKETLNDQNFDKKLARPRMGMVADMVEAEQRAPVIQRLRSNAEQRLGNCLLAVPEVSGLPEGKEESSGGVGGTEQAEKKEDAGERVEEQTDALEHLGCGQEAKGLDVLEEGVGELEFHKEEGCLQSQVMSEKAVGNLESVNLIEGKLREKMKRKKEKPAPRM